MQVFILCSFILSGIKVVGYCWVVQILWCSGGIVEIFLQDIAWAKYEIFGKQFSASDSSSESLCDSWIEKHSSSDSDVETISHSTRSYFLVNTSHILNYSFVFLFGLLFSQWLGFPQTKHVDLFLGWVIFLKTNLLPFEEFLKDILFFTGNAPLEKCL